MPSCAAVASAPRAQPLLPRSAERRADRAADSDPARAAGVAVLGDELVGGLVDEPGGGAAVAIWPRSPAALAGWAVSRPFPHTSSEGIGCAPGPPPHCGSARGAGPPRS